MSAQKNILLVGLGSPFGDDQFGWRVIEALGQCKLADLTVRQARSAGEILDWLDGLDQLIVCDACQGSGPVGTIHRWRWPVVKISPTRFSGSHDLGLAAVLALAEQLGKLPREVVVWAVEGRQAALAESQPDAQLSPEVERAVPRIAALIKDELSHA